MSGSYRKLFVSQYVYTKEIIDCFGMADHKFVATPTDKSYHDLPKQKSVQANGVPYRQTVGSLMYLMIN